MSKQCFPTTLYQVCILMVMQHRLTVAQQSAEGAKVLEGDGRDTLRNSHRPHLLQSWSRQASLLDVAGHLLVWRSRRRRACDFPERLLIRDLLVCTEYLVRTLLSTPESSQVRVVNRYVLLQSIVGTSTRCLEGHSGDTVHQLRDAALTPGVPRPAEDLDDVSYIESLLLPGLFLGLGSISLPRGELAWLRWLCRCGPPWPVSLVGGFGGSHQRRLRLPGRCRFHCRRKR
mmetsp:Transcript_11177/g.25627  ORF Transcript_11177/g.25627 Transcript_11177/m.25627 type:complete len:230 (-) Transcript_11177:1166-1855(-)